MSVQATSARGSVSLVALILAAVIGISLASYLALCQKSLLFSTRTMHLDRARLLAETGLEEALWSLNASAHPTAAVKATAWTNATWTTSGLNKSCTLTGYTLGNGATGSIELTIQNFDGPTQNLSISAPNITSSATITVPGMGDFRRTLTAKASPAPAFPNAIGIVNGFNGQILFNSAGLVDSWDSDYLATTPIGSLPVGTPNRNYAPSALGATNYPGSSPITLPATSLPSPYQTNAISTYPSAAFNYSAAISAPSITLNNAEIRGYVATFGNIPTYNSNSKVTANPAPGTPPPPPNIEPTRIGSSAFVPEFDIAIPSGNSGNLASLYTSDNPIPDVGSNIWYAPSGLEVDGTSGGAALEVTQPTVIIVQGDLHLHHNGRIKITPPFGRLEIIVQGNITVGPFSGSVAGFQNDTNLAKNLIVYSTAAGSRTFHYQSTRNFCGVFYSTSTNSRMLFSSASPNPIFFGAFLAKYHVEFGSGMDPELHYDTALQHLPKGWFRCMAVPFILDQITETP